MAVTRGTRGASPWAGEEAVEPLRQLLRHDLRHGREAARAGEEVEEHLPGHKLPARPATLVGGGGKQTHLTANECSIPQAQCFRRMYTGLHEKRKKIIIFQIIKKTTIYVRKKNKLK